MFENKGKSLLMGATFLTAVNLLSQLITFIYRMILTRLIGPEAVGLNSLTMPIYSILTSICYSGISVAVARLVAENSYDKYGDKTSLIIKKSLRIFMTVAVISSLSVLIFSDFISEKFAGDIRIKPSLLLLLPCMMLTGIENISKNYYYGLSIIKVPAIMDISEQIIRFMSVIILLLLFSPQKPEYSLVCISVGLIIGELYSSVTLTILRNRHLRKTRIIEKKQYKNITSDIIKIALPVIATNFSGSLMEAVNTSLVPKQLIASGLNETEALETVGKLYGVSMPLLSLPMVFISAISTVLIPNIARLKSQNKKSELSRKIKMSVSASMMIMTSITAFIIPIMPTLSKLLFGQELLNEKYGLLPVAVIVVSLQVISSSVLYGLGRLKTVTVSSVIGDYVQVFLTYILIKIPSVRTDGFAVSLLISSFITTTINFYVILKEEKMAFDFSNWLFKPLLMSIPPFFISTVTEAIIERTGYSPVFAIIGGTLTAIIITVFTILLSNNKISYKFRPERC